MKFKNKEINFYNNFCDKTTTDMNFKEGICVKKFLNWYIYIYNNLRNLFCCQKGCSRWWRWSCWWRWRRCGRCSSWWWRRRWRCRRCGRCSCRWWRRSCWWRCSIEVVEEVAVDGEEEVTDGGRFGGGFGSGYRWFSNLKKSKNWSSKNGLKSRLRYVDKKLWLFYVFCKEKGIKIRLI